MFKVAFIGAGSIGFTRKLLEDLLAVPEFHNIEVSFTDINQRNLDMVTQLCQRDIDANGLPIKIHATMNRREAFAGAKYVINAVRVGGLEAFATDVNIPLKYGVDQCVGDTICAGGIMYGQRDIPVMLEFCKDIREVAASGCILLNYANPNAMVTWACNKYGGVQTLGLCHGVQHGHSQIAELLGADKKDVDIICAGINHQTWYVSVKLRGEEVCQKELLQKFMEHPHFSETEKVRIDVMKRFGYYSTESNGHLSEYLPWYRKNAAEITRWTSMDSWAGGQTGGYLRICTEGRNWFETDFPNWLKEEPVKFGKRSDEHGSFIIEALETGRVYRGHFNVVNNGCITNLPDDAIVEVPCYVDFNGINVPKVGDLPLGCAAVCNVSISVQRLAVEAGVHGDLELLVQAMMMDPLVGAVCAPDMIAQMTDEMLIAGEEWLPQYENAIAQAKIKQQAPEWVELPEYEGAVRLSVKSVGEMQQDAEKSRAIVKASEKASFA